MYADWDKFMHQMNVSNVAKSKRNSNSILSCEFRPSGGKHWSAKLPLKVYVLTADGTTNGRTVYLYNLITQCYNSL